LSGHGGLSLATGAGPRVLIGDSWSSASDALALLNHPGHSSQKSHGRKGGAEDISGSIDYDALPRNDNDPDIDPTLGAILAKQGFDGPPTVVSRADFDRAVATGEVEETYRGIHGSAHAEQAEQFRSGALYVGTGIHGNGTYVATSRAEALRHADGGTVLRIGLRRDARVITDTDLKAEMAKYRRANKDRDKRVTELDREMRQKANDTDDDDTAGRIAIYDRYKALKDEAVGAEYRVRQEPGRFAALQGYDAIRVTDRERSGASEAAGADDQELVILNRTAVIVEQA
jgi:hypothetical protein